MKRGDYTIFRSVKSCYRMKFNIIVLKIQFPHMEGICWHVKKTIIVRMPKVSFPIPYLHPFVIHFGFPQFNCKIIFVYPHISLILFRNPCDPSSIRIDNSRFLLPQIKRVLCTVCGIQLKGKQSTTSCIKSHLHGQGIVDHNRKNHRVRDRMQFKIDPIWVGMRILFLASGHSNK